MSHLTHFGDNYLQETSVVAVNHNRHRHYSVLLSLRHRRPRDVLGLKRDGFCVYNFFLSEH